MSSKYDRETPDEFLEHGFLVGVNIKGSRPLLSADDSLAELAQLAATAGIEVVGQSIQSLEHPNPATFIGPGKLEEIREEIAQTQADTVIFDDELSPRHQRELEKALGEEIKVVDRSALILDIFARHAQTREGALQVELAQYEYRLPRLTRQWTHLARQAGGGAARAGGGGVGLRGPGETQLEADRREIGNRITKLKREIDAIRAHRSRHRQQRKEAGLPLVALVGYTNAGKSTLLNLLSNANVYVADQLFATLDPTVRRAEIGRGQTILFSDTVGFIQKLPTTLIAAFRATLEEIAEASLLLHVADVSHPNVAEQIDSVEDTLAELDLPRMPHILVLNKIDAVKKDPLALLPSGTTQGYNAIVPISARTGLGIDRLMVEIEQLLAKGMGQLHILVPFDRGDIVSRIHEQGSVISERHTPEGVEVRCRVPQELAAQIGGIAAVIDLSRKKSKTE